MPRLLRIFLDGEPRTSDPHPNLLHPRVMVVEPIGFFPDDLPVHDRMT
ncbi:MAG TPA: hypothetical protein VGS09_06620 [Actinomycetota bacterium]|nr:hypothetical protein [Actinomycetota bacterium]